MLCSLLQTSAVPAFAADAAGSSVDINGAQTLDDTATEVTSGGTYKISGTRQNPVKITAAGEVVLVLDNVTITTQTSPIELANGAQVTLVVKDGTTNALTCTATAANASNGGKTAGILVPKTATLTIDTPKNSQGTGKLTVNGGYGGAGIGGGAAVGQSTTKNATVAANGTKAPDAEGYINMQSIGKAFGGGGGGGGESGLNGANAESAGTVNIKNGVLTVIGGTGGAGIGGGMGAAGSIGQSGKEGGKGENGYSVHRTVNGAQTIQGIGGAGGGGGGQGGIGGVGGTGGAGAALNIENGSLAITAGEGAAAIGGGAGGVGGKGATGGNGGTGGNNVTISVGSAWLNPGTGGGGQGGQGGTGGSGGTGGAGGSVNITGGTISLNSADSTAIGGGQGGVGGAGGQGGNGGQGHGAHDGENYETRYSGKAGAAGKGGAGGSGGVGASLSISGGVITANSAAAANDIGGGVAGTNGAEGTAGQAGAVVGTTPVSAGQNGWTLWCWAATEGGAAGASNPVYNQTNGASSTITIATTNQHELDFLKTYKPSKYNNIRIQDANGNPLYRVVLDIQNQKNPTQKADNAVVDISNDGVRYSTVADENGKAVLWLPSKQIELVGSTVFHEKYGTIREQDKVTLQLTSDMTDGNARPVKLYIAEKIEWKVTGAANNKTLYEYKGDVAQGRTDLLQTAIYQYGYKVTGVIVKAGTQNLTEGTNYTWNENTSTVDISLDGLDLQTLIDITFTYADNLTEIKIQGFYQGTTTPIENFPDIKVQAEIGKAYTYGPLPLDGYDFEGTVPKLDTVSGNPAQDILTYYYTKKQGNVTYRAVDANNPGIVLAQKTERLAKGAAIDCSQSKAETLFGTIDYYTITAGDGTAVDATGAAVTTYSGISDVTVTYQYTRNQRDVKVIRWDVAANRQIDERTILNLDTGKVHQLDLSTLPALPTYAQISGNPSYFVTDDQNQSVTVYYRPATTCDVTVKIVDENDKEINRYTISGTPGVQMTITPNSYTGYEFNGTADEKANGVKITPIAGGDNIVTMKYRSIMYDITVKLLDTQGADISGQVTAFQTRQQVQEGQPFVVTAPNIPGYSLIAGCQPVQSLTAEEIKKDTSKRTIIFTYDQVAAENFVKHTILFKLDNHPLYEHTKLVPKGNGDPVIYDESSISYVVPGFTLQSITYTVGSTSGTDADIVKDNADATITYDFREDAAQIVIKHVDNANTVLKKDETDVPDKVLTGYRNGQQGVVVVAPALDGFVLVGDLTQKVDLHAGSNPVNFKYTTPGNVTLTLKEKTADGADRIIRVLSPSTATTYTAGSGDLDLKAYGYIYSEGDTTGVFNQDGKLEITNDALTNKKNYDIYYTKKVRDVQYILVDKSKLTDPTHPENATTEQIIKTETVTGDARVGESYVAAARQLDGYTLADALTKVISEVKDEPGAVKVYFLYTKKQSGSVQIVYRSEEQGQTLLSYTVQGAIGEDFTASAPATWENGKYKLKNDGLTSYNETTGGTKTITVQAANSDVVFTYTKNFVTVSTSTKVGTSTAAHDSVTVKKGEGVTLTPPAVKGYDLVGITATGYTLTNGGETQMPDEWDAQAQKLTLKNLQADAQVVYHYKAIEENITEYQVRVTVKDQYERYELGSRTETVTKNVASSITPKQYAGYTLSAYQIGNEAKQNVAANLADRFTLSHAFTANTDVTFFYTRTDGSAVVPGGNGNLGDNDDVIIKPNGSDKPTFTDKPEAGSVKVPNGAEVVTPDGTVIPPDGSVVKPDGTIVVPDQGGNFNPGTTIDPANPDQVAPNYLYIKYLPNGGKGEGFTQFFKAGNAVTVATNRFTADNKTADGWNTQEDGEGTDYAAKATINLTESLTLYAKWSKAAYKYKVTITFDSNNGANSETKTQVIGSHSNKTFSGKLAANTFTINGWTFCGWNEKRDGSNAKDYVNEEKVTFTVIGEETLTLYAQWYRFHADGSITVPGKDNTPNTDKDVTVHPNGDKPPALDKEGNIEVPSGGKVTTPDGTIIPPDGSIVKPDGTIVAPDANGNRNPGVTIDPTSPNAPAPYFVVTYAYGIAGSNVQAVRQYGKGSLTILTASPFAAPAGKEFAGWTKDGQDFTDQTVDTSVTLTAKWKDSTGSGGNTGGGGGGGGSVIVIGGGGGSKVPQKPTIIVDENTKYELSEDGTAVTLITKDGYQVNSIIVNGEEKGGAEAITGLKTGDIVKISAICYLDVIEEAQSYRLVARSKLVKRKNGMHPVKVKVSWYDENGKELKLDGYEIERSRKRYTDYQLRFKTDRKFYYNTFIQDGAKYYYRVRGYILFNGQKYYTRWSKKAWRTVKM